jgi:hypothetical protein
VDTVSDPEFGGPEELGIGLGGEQLRDAPDLVTDGREPPPLDPVGLVALLGSQIEGKAGHGVGLS